MKKILAIILACLIITSMLGCESTGPVYVGVDNKENVMGNAFGKSALTEIGDYLWYDSTTRIVYWWNGNLYDYRSDTTPSPYYAPNGLPYRYNPETNTFEEINCEHSF
jgi:hypothetical protein